MSAGRSRAVYAADGPRVRCPECGETRIRAGMLPEHRRTLGHPLPILPDAAVDAFTLELRERFRASLRALPDA